MSGGKVVVWSFKTPVISSLLSLNIKVDATVWLELSLLPFFIEHPAMKNSFCLDVCGCTVSQRYGIFHIEEKVVVTHNDKLSD